MELRFYIDPDSGEPHIASHAVEESEAEEPLERPLEDRPGRDGARIALGQTRSGRYLRVIYVPDPERGSIFVMPAYEPGPQAIKALKRRLKRRR